ncbi:MAG: hypothetical protein QXI09_01855 [Candidatus Aenigmatarchaeota archaeon]
METKEIEQLKKEREDLLLLISQLEEEYNKANLSEKVYKEAKEKYEKRLSEINKKLGIKEEKKGGFLKNVFKKEKKEESPYISEKSEGPTFIDPLNPPKEVEEVKEENISMEGGQEKIYVELEKIKAFIESLRETDKTLNEQIRNLAEAIGEIRSTVFQVDGSLKELEMKLEKIENDVEEIKPNKIEKKFLDLEKKLEGLEIFKEKSEKRFEDLLEKMKKINEFMRSAGRVENLVKISREINQKSEEIKEAIRYIERIAAKVERAFTEMNKNLSEFILYKGKQESLEENFREAVKNLEEIKTKIENVATLKDLESFKADIFSLKSQIDEINKVLPIVETKIPETIQKLREERDDILLLIKALDNDLQLGRISIGDYNKSRENALKKLREINEKLVEEWKKIEKFIEEGGLEALPIERVVEEKEYNSENMSTEKKIEIKEGEESEKEIEKMEKKEKNEFENLEKKEEAYLPKVIEPVKVEGEEDLIKFLKKVKEEI